MARSKKSKLAVVTAEAPPVKVVKTLEMKGLRGSLRSVAIVYEGSAEGVVDVLKAFNAMLGERDA